MNFAGRQMASLGEPQSAGQAKWKSPCSSGNGARGMEGSGDLEPAYRAVAGGGEKLGPGLSAFGDAGRWPWCKHCLLWSGGWHEENCSLKCMGSQKHRRIFVEPSDKSDDMKAKIQEAEGTYPVQQSVTYVRMQLDEKMVVRELSIYVRVRGGNARMVQYREGCCHLQGPASVHQPRDLAAEKEDARNQEESTMQGARKERLREAA